MHPGQPLPRLWLMTDERFGDGLLDAIGRLPRGGGIVFRHYSLDPAARRKLFEQVRSIARRRGLVVLLAGTAELARAWGAHGSHGRGRSLRGRSLRSAPVHDLREIRAAEHEGADLLFLSPAYPTRSHPGAPALGPCRFGQLAHSTRLPVIALGGMDAGRGWRLRALGAHGWAGIDFFLRN